LIDIKGFLHS